MIKSPCMGCQRRFVGCRRSCVSWSAYTIEKEDYDKVKNEIKRARQDASSYTLEVIRRNKKRRKYNAV